MAGPGLSPAFVALRSGKVSEAMSAVSRYMLDEFYIPEFRTRPTHLELSKSEGNDYRLPRPVAPGYDYEASLLPRPMPFSFNS